MSALIAEEGLSIGEARRRPTQYRPNSIEDIADRPLRRLVGEVSVIFALLLFNAAIGFFQESRAQATLSALKSRLSLTAAVLRDQQWKVLPAAQWMSGDVVGADVRISTGDVLLDYYLHLNLASLQSLAFILIVFGNQATTYTNRERRHLWASSPSRWVLIASGADIVIAAVLAVGGIAMQALPVTIVLGCLVGTALLALAIDLLKVPAFRRLQIG